MPFTYWRDLEEVLIFHEYEFELNIEDVDAESILFECFNCGYILEHDSTTPPEKECPNCFGKNAYETTTGFEHALFYRIEEDDDYPEE